MHLLILGYHIVDDLSSESMLATCVRIDAFGKQMAYLSRHGYRTVTLDEWVLALEGKLDLPPRPIAITFDDGYKDTLANAWPQLRLYGFLSTVFVVAGLIGQTNHWDEVIGLPARELLSADDIYQIIGAEGEIGSHGLTHSNLAEASPAKLMEEVQRSKALLEEELSTQVGFFAYPYGVFNSEVRRMVKVSGYRGACCARPGTNHARTDPYALRRVFISAQDGPLRFALKVRFARLLGLKADIWRLLSKSNQTRRRVM